MWEMTVMSGRRVLIIGSQCRRLNHLSFLPEVAVRFHELMTGPGPGECLGADADRRRWLKELPGSL
jgi:hypothetical protein